MTKKLYILIIFIIFLIYVLCRSYKLFINFIYKRCFNNLFKNNKNIRNINIKSSRFINNLVYNIFYEFTKEKKKENLYYIKKNLIYTIETDYKIDVLPIVSILITILLGVVSKLDIKFSKETLSICFLILLGCLWIILIVRFYENIKGTFYNLCIDIIEDIEIRNYTYSCIYNKYKKKYIWKIKKY